MNEMEVTLRVGAFSNICWKLQLSQQDVITETFYLNYFIEKRV